MDAARQQLSIGLIGVLVGGTLGAIFGVAVGSTSNSTATATQIETVVRTQSPNLTRTQLLSIPTTPTTQDTQPVDTVPPIVAPNYTPTTGTGFTAPPTTTSTTPTAGLNSNGIPPADPSNPEATFCNTHVCGPSFAKGDGPAVQCADGVWTRQGGEPVTCAADGGLGKAGGGQ